MEYTFHIGSHNPTVKSNKRTKNKNPSTISNKKMILQEKMDKFQEKFSEVNSVYASNKAFAFLSVNKPILFHPSQTGEITILIPKTEQSAFVYNALSMHSYSLFEWYLYFLEMTMDSTYLIYGPMYYHQAYSLYLTNQNLRWKLKRLFSHWLKKKCEKKHIGADSDIFTHEPIPPKHCITIQCCVSRCLYSFHANTLLKAIRSNLETQVNSIPVIKPPLNPYTNIPFTYGQLIHIYSETLKWSANNNKVFPTTFALYREARFRPKLLERFNIVNLQYRAIVNYCRNDDMDCDFFIDNLYIFLKKYKNCIVSRRSKMVFLNLHAFRKWHIENPNHPILKQWKSFIRDFWFYEQIGIFPKVIWNSVINMIQEFNTLFAISIPTLRAIFFKSRNTIEAQLS